MEKIVKCRKDYKCNQCESIIKKGEKALYGSERRPKYDENDNQIGIEYVSWRLHDDYNICISINKQRNN
jgi:hypothetical protein